MGHLARIQTYRIMAECKREAKSDRHSETQLNAAQLKAKVNKNLIKSVSPPFSLTLGKTNGE